MRVTGKTKCKVVVWAGKITLGDRENEAYSTKKNPKTHSEKGDYLCKVF